MRDGAANYESTDDTEEKVSLSYTVSDTGLHSRSIPEKSGQAGTSCVIIFSKWAVLYYYQLCDRVSDFQIRFYQRWNIRVISVPINLSIYSFARSLPFLTGGGSILVSCKLFF